MVLQRAKALTMSMRQMSYRIPDPNYNILMIYVDKDATDINSAMRIFLDDRILSCLWDVKVCFTVLK